MRRQHASDVFCGRRAAGAALLRSTSTAFSIADFNLLALAKGAELN